jgi:hypothetical protein
MGRKTRQEAALRPDKTPEGRRLGRRPSYTDEVGEIICGHVENRVPITTAATLAGVGQSTLFRWLSIAEAAREEIEAWHEQHPDDPHTLPPDVDPAALRFVEFGERLARARATAETKTVASVAKAIDGGYLVSEEPAVTGEGTPIYDEDGNLTFKRRWAEPDGKLGLEFLARSFPARWGKDGPIQVEVSGPGGAPLQVESSAHIAALAERLATQRALGAAPAVQEIEDGVLVDDDPVTVAERERVRALAAPHD